MSAVLCLSLTLRISQLALVIDKTAEYSASIAASLNYPCQPNCKMIRPRHLSSLPSHTPLARLENNVTRAMNFLTPKSATDQLDSTDTIRLVPESLISIPTSSGKPALESWSPCTEHQGKSGRRSSGGHGGRGGVSSIGGAGLSLSEDVKRIPGAFAYSGLQRAAIAPSRLRNKGVRRVGTACAYPR